MSRDSETLLHIQNAGLLIQDFIEDLREDAFMTDMKHVLRSYINYWL